MRHRQADLLGLLAGERNDLRQLLSRELRRYAAPLLVCQYVQQDSLQLRVRNFWAACGDQLFVCRRKPPSPAIDPLLVDPQRGGLGHARPSISRPENYLHPFGEPPLQLPRPRQPLEDRSLPLIQEDRTGRSRHDPAA